MPIYFARRYLGRLTAFEPPLDVTFEPRVAVAGPHCNGRLLTAIYYANPHWTKADGGCLRLYKAQAAPICCHERCHARQMITSLRLVWAACGDMREHVFLPLPFMIHVS